MSLIDSAIQALRPRPTGEAAARIEDVLGDVQTEFANSLKADRTTFRSLVRKLAGGQRLGREDRRALAGLVSSGFVTEDGVRNAVVKVEEFESTLRSVVEAVRRANAAKLDAAGLPEREKALVKELNDVRARMITEYYESLAASQSIGGLRCMASEHPELFEDINVAELIDRHVEPGNVGEAAK